MKATGVIRRVDELGRVVIAKEVRDSMGISAGTKLEMSVAQDGVILRKHEVGAGMARHIDQLGRLVIAKEIRKRLDWGTGTPLELFVDGDTLLFKEYAPGCVACGNVTDDFVNVNSKRLCLDCANEVVERVLPRRKSVGA